jgi:hypothetical protein
MYVFITGTISGDVKHLHHHAAEVAQLVFPNGYQRSLKAFVSRTVNVGLYIGHLIRLLANILSPTGFCLQSGSVVIIAILLCFIMRKGYSERSKCRNKQEKINSIGNLPYLSVKLFDSRNLGTKSAHFNP